MKKISSLFQYVLFLSLGVFLVWYSIHQIPNNKWAEFKQALQQANYLLFIPVFFILSLSHVLRALRWKILIEPLGFDPKLANCFFAVMIGYMSNLAVPRLGEVLKCTILAKYEKVPAEKIVGTIVAERAFDLICLVILFGMAIALHYQVVIDCFTTIPIIGTNEKKQSNNHFFTYAVVAIIALAILLFIFNKHTFKKMMHRIQNIAKGIIEGLLSAGRVKHKSLFIAYSVGIWLLYIVGTWIGLYATANTGVSFTATIVCLAFASIGMIITPGGIGAYAIFLAHVLKQFGVDETLGLANGTLQWFAQTIIVLVVGLLCMFALPWFNKAKTNVTP